MRALVRRPFTRLGLNHAPGEIVELIDPVFLSLKAERLVTEAPVPPEISIPPIAEIEMPKEFSAAKVPQAQSQEVPQVESARTTGKPHMARRRK